MIRFQISRALDNSESAKQFSDLFNSIYHRKVNAAYYHWQFFACPFPATLLFAEHPDGRVIGCYGMQYRPSSPDGVTVAWTIDMMVAEAYRQQGVWTALAEAAAAEAIDHETPVLAVLANDPGAEALANKCGWTRSATVADCVVSSIRVPKQTDVRFRKIQSQNDAAMPASDTIHSRRTNEYITWRFFNHPIHKYEVFRAEASGRVLGSVFLKTFTNEHGMRTLDLVDWMGVEEPAVLDAVLNFARGIAHERGVSEVSTWLIPGSPWAAVGNRIGFHPTSRRKHFCCKILDEQCRAFESVSAWHLMMAESDVY